MKTAILFIYITCLFVCSCNNAGQNSTEVTDSSNQKMTDSGSNSTAGSKPDSGTTTTPVHADEATSGFLSEAIDGGMAEVQGGLLAQQKTSDPSIKDFGAMMVNDHSAGNDKIKALAIQRNVALPVNISTKHQKLMNDLDKRSGRDFDKAYINAMVKDHQEDISEFEKEEKRITDTDVKAFILNTLPILKTHLDSARAIQKRLK